MSAAFDAADELSREVLMGAEVRTWRDDGEEGEGPEFATLFQQDLTDRMSLLQSIKVRYPHQYFSSINLLFVGDEGSIPEAGGAFLLLPVDSCSSRLLHYNAELREGLFGRRVFVLDVVG